MLAHMSAPNREWQPIDFTIYFSCIGLWLAVLIVGELALRILALQANGGMLTDGVEYLSWLWRLAIIIVTGWRVTKLFGPVPMIGAIAGTLMGLCLGIIVSLSRFASGFAIWKVFNIVTETTILTLVAALMLVVITTVASFRRSKTETPVSNN